VVVEILGGYREYADFVYIVDMFPDTWAGNKKTRLSGEITLEKTGYLLFNWWRRRESNPRPQMLPFRIYMLSSRLEVSRKTCRGNRAGLTLVYEDLVA